MKSKTQTILQTREEFLSLFRAYSGCAQDWDPKEEDDYDSLVMGVDEILEKIVYSKEN